MQQLTRRALGALALAAAATGPASAAEPFRPEKVTVDTVPDDVPLVFAADLAFDHLPDGRVHLFDARDFSYRGLISSGFLGLVYVPPKGDKLILATSYLDRYTRGTRSDFVEIYNPRTQVLEAEIPIPPRRAQAILYRPLLQGSSDGKLLFVQNATPATSVTVVDLGGKSPSARWPRPAATASIRPRPPRTASPSCAATAPPRATAAEIADLRRRPVADFSGLRRAIAAAIAHQGGDIGSY